jgi:hypothetical protein
VIVGIDDKTVAFWGRETGERLKRYGIPVYRVTGAGSRHLIAAPRWTWVISVAFKMERARGVWGAIKRTAKDPGLRREVETCAALASGATQAVAIVGCFR